MNCIINQPAGLGDILFCQKIGKLLDYNVIWPTSPQYDYISSYIPSEIKHVPYSSLSDGIKTIFNSSEYNITNINIDGEEYVYIPLTHSHISFPNTSVMESKYKFLNIDYDNWGEYFDIIRDSIRENTLINHLNIDLKSDYNLINLNFGTYPEFVKYNKHVKIENEYKNISMDFLGFDRLFDWIPIIENAQEIHTVNTSLVYIIEKLNIKGKLFMYNRNEPTFDRWYSKNMYRADWKYITYD